MKLHKLGLDEETRALALNNYKKLLLKLRIEILIKAVANKLKVQWSTI